MAAARSCLSAERVLPMLAPRLTARLGVLLALPAWPGWGEAASDCCGLELLRCHLLLLLRKGNLYSKGPASLLPLYSTTGTRYSSEQPLSMEGWMQRKKDG